MTQRDKLFNMFMKNPSSVSYQELQKNQPPQGKPMGYGRVYELK